MPFVEYLGGGRQKREIGSMESTWDSVWDSVWEGNIHESSKKLKAHETWGLISKYMPPPPGQLLEAGCGLAKWVNLFREEGYDAYGLDYSSEAINNSLKAWPELNLLQGDIKNMPYEDGFFDGVVSLGAIEHDEGGPEAMLAGMHRVLRKDGVMLCSVPCLNLLRRSGLYALKRCIVCSPTIRKLTGRNPEVSFYQYVFTPSEYTTLIENAGFDMIALAPMSPPTGGIFGRSGIWRRFILSIHKTMPWLSAHMMAAVCRKK